MTGIKQIKQGLVTIFTVQAALIGDITDALRQQMHTCLEAGELQLILDFRQVSCLDSAALEMLLSCSRLARRKGGSIKIVHLSEVCHDILVATRLEQFLEVYPNISKALQSCL
jgi:anti-anti-sigma factor